MPACEGPPGMDNRCPYKRKGASVKLRQGDMDLCDDCFPLHFPDTQSGQPVLGACASDVSNSSDGIQNGIQSVQNTNDCRGNSTSSGHLILQPLLTYIAFSIQSGTVDSVKRAVKSYFSLAQIIDA